MATLNDLLRLSTQLESLDREWLHLLVGDWQLISDLSFADLILWVRRSLLDADAESEDAVMGEWVAVAHVRPNTGQMVFYNDVVGRASMPHLDALLDEAIGAGTLVRAPQVHHHDEMRVREEAFPVLRGGRPIAVV